MPNQDRYLQSEERQKAIVEQKRLFLAGGQVDRSVISGMILRSWERSLAARVNPDVKERPRVGGEELEAVLAENAELMDCARDILEQMFSSMQEAVSALSLVSARGVTLYISNRVSHRAYYPDALVGSINTGSRSPAPRRFLSAGRSPPLPPGRSWGRIPAAPGP